MRSDDLRWAWALGHVAERLRGTCPFRHGNTIDVRVAELTALAHRYAGAGT